MIPRNLFPGLFRIADVDREISDRRTMIAEMSESSLARSFRDDIALLRQRRLALSASPLRTWSFSP